MKDIPKIILIFLAVDWPVFMRRKMVIALAEAASRFGSTVVAVNRPLCPFTTFLKKPNRAREIFKKPHVEKLADNLYLFSAKYLIHDHIASKFKILERLNLAALRRGYQYLQDQINLHEKSPVVWYYYPQQGYVSKLFPKSFCIYEIYDNLTDIKGEENPYLNRLQAKYRDSVDLLFTTSQKLHEKYAKDYGRASISGNGLDRETCMKLASKEIEPLPEITAIKSPRIGFTGMISNRLDWNLVSALAAMKPEWNFIFVGRVTDPRLRRNLSAFSNIHFMGEYDHSLIPAVLKSFDLGYMPYLDNDFFRYSNPLKFYEFAAAGLPSVSSNMEELAKFPPQIVRIVPNEVARWAEAIQTFLRLGGESARSIGPEIARRYIWEDMTINLFNQLVDLLDDNSRY